ncbi:calcineurin-binding protein cabin-1-like [Lineus longissimus]|uniref:calcineurin-binding protein cabin-1-like n=1 Tax=Lineus longissimus TaxID=88925 RepID=UPI002B4F4906
MIRIAALNDDSSDDDGTGGFSCGITTKEAQESEAFSIYNKGLSLQRQGDTDAAKDVLQSLLDSSLIKNAARKEDQDTGNLLQPDMLLKYSAYKNLASIAAHRGDYNDAMESYLEAVNVDSSDVTLWHKIGTTAIKLDNYQLAKFAFMQGLSCNKNHWPCLDHAITVLYALNNYTTCLYYIGQALERDPGYLKGLAFRQQIFSEQASLKKECSEYFQNCDLSIDDDEVDQEVAEKYINEGVEIRRKRRELCKVPDPPPLTFPVPLKSFTWKHLGECLIVLYDKLAGKPYPRSVCSRVDLTMYENMNPDAGIHVVDTSLIETVLSEMSQLVSPASSVTSTPILPHTPLTVLMDFTPDLMKSAGSTPTAMDVDDITKPGSKKRGPKRKRLCEELDPFIYKRRSARVRDTGKKKQEESVNYQDLLQKFLPSSLRNYVEESEDVAEVNSGHPQQTLDAVDGEKVELSPEDDGNTWTVDEAKSVHQFLKDRIINGGAVDLMIKFLLKLASKLSEIWPPEMTAIYVKIYTRVRKHFSLPSYWFKEVSDEHIQNMAKVALLWTEFKMDNWLQTRAKTSSSPNGARKSPAMSSLRLSADFPGEYFNDDVSYLMGLMSYSDVMEVFWQEFCVRVLWLKAHFFILNCETEMAAGAFDQITSFLSDIRQESSVNLVVKLKNCRSENIISMDTVQKQIESLHRCQSLEELQRLYEQEKYQNVVNLLMPTFKSGAPKGKSIAEVNQGIPERHAQLLLLQDSLLKLKNYEMCLLWGEVSINEALQCYLNVQTTEAKEEWISTMTQLFEGVEKSLRNTPGIIKTLPAKNLVRFSHNLIRVIELAMDIPEGSTEIIGTVLPWILLYRLIEHEETKFRKLKEAEGDFSHDWDTGMPSSLMLLNVAHEYLGRRSWCTNSDGALLILFLEVIEVELKKYGPSGAHPLQDDLENALEQCLYCLYSYPNKKAKVRHLQDHNAAQVTLIWDRSILLFDYYKPKTVPEFDSYKTSTVSADLENLLRRICPLVPVQPKPPFTIEMLNNYIDGLTSTPPSLPADYVIEGHAHVIKEMYYLLADYYFKNKEPAKAIKFYLHDICVNPDRFDSWAGMALARSSRLEQKLNSNELKSEGNIHKNAIAVLRCFRRALELDDSNSKLWIEYGAFAYALHMYASRQLKQQCLFPLNEENRKIAESSRDDMLKTAENCYIKAGECGDADEIEERWLHHYMLGKIAEKMHRHPRDYLEHYKESARFLYEDNARYPKKIHYIVSPPHLAVEALEVHYRLHVSIIKYLLRHTKGIPLELYEVFDQHIKAAAESPFALTREKRHEKRESRSDLLSATLDESSSSNLTAPTPITPPKSGRPTYHQNPVDHDYSKQKSMDSSCDDSMDILSSPPRGEGSSSEVESNEGILEISRNMSGRVSSEEEGKIELSQKSSAPSPLADVSLTASAQSPLTFAQSPLASAQNSSADVMSESLVVEHETMEFMDNAAAESQGNADRDTDIEIKNVVAEILEDILDKIAALGSQSFEGLEGVMSVKEVYDFFQEEPMWASSPLPTFEDSQDAVVHSSATFVRNSESEPCTKVDIEESVMKHLILDILNDLISLAIDAKEKAAGDATAIILDDTANKSLHPISIPSEEESDCVGPVPILISTSELSMETENSEVCVWENKDVERYVELITEDETAEAEEEVGKPVDEADDGSVAETQGLVEVCSASEAAKFQVEASSNSKTEGQGRAKSNSESVRGQVEVSSLSKAEGQGEVSSVERAVEDREEVSSAEEEVEKLMESNLSEDRSSGIKDNIGIAKMEILEGGDELRVSVEVYNELIKKSAEKKAVERLGPDTGKIVSKNTETTETDMGQSETQPFDVGDISEVGEKVEGTGSGDMVALVTAEKIAAISALGGSGDSTRKDSVQECVNSLISTERPNLLEVQDTKDSTSEYPLETAPITPGEIVAAEASLSATQMSCSGQAEAQVSTGPQLDDLVPELQDKDETLGAPPTEQKLNDIKSNDGMSETDEVKNISDKVKESEPIDQVEQDLSCAGSHDGKTDAPTCSDPKAAGSCSPESASMNASPPERRKSGSNEDASEYLSKLEDVVQQMLENCQTNEEQSKEDAKMDADSTQVLGKDSDNGSDASLGFQTDLDGFGTDFDKIDKCLEAARNLASRTEEEMEAEETPELMVPSPADVNEMAPSPADLKDTATSPADGKAIAPSPAEVKKELEGSGKDTGTEEMEKDTKILPSDTKMDKTQGPSSGTNGCDTDVKRELVQDIKIKKEAIDDGEDALDSTPAESKMAADTAENPPTESKEVEMETNEGTLKADEPSISKKETAASEKLAPEGEKNVNKPHSADASIDDKKEVSKTDESSESNKELAASAKQTTEKQTTNGATVVNKPDSADVSIQYNKELIDECIKGLHRCLWRFPMHYKSIYQLARIYTKSPWHKDLKYASDYLLGSPAWQTMPHMSSPGLFQERKQTNIFNNIWRMPIEEIDRCGSFATHMYRSVALLIDVMKDLGDVNVLLFAHNQLAKTPEGTKKYMRDAERIALSKKAFKSSQFVIRKRLKASSRETNPDVLHNLLADIHKVWNAGIKLEQGSEEYNSLLVDGFKLCKPDMIEPQPSILEQAIAYCNHHLTMKVQTPSHSDAKRSSISEGPASPKWRTITEEDQEKISKLSEQQGGKSKLEKMPILTKIMKESKPKSPGHGLTLSLPKHPQMKQGGMSKGSPLLLKPGLLQAAREQSSSQPQSPIKDPSSSPRVVDAMKLVKPCSVRLVKSPELHSYPVPSPPRITPIDLSMMRTIPEETVKSPTITQRYSNPTPFINVSKSSTAIKPHTSSMKTVHKMDSGVKSVVRHAPYTTTYQSSQALQRFAQKASKPAFVPKTSLVSSMKASLSSSMKHSNISKVKQSFSPMTLTPITRPSSTHTVTSMLSRTPTSAPKAHASTPRAPSFTQKATAFTPKAPSGYSYVQLVTESSRTPSNQPYPVGLLAAPRAPTAPSRLLPPANPMVIEISDDSD